MPRRGMILVSPTQSVPQVLAVWGSNKKEESSVQEVRDYGSIKKSNPDISTKIHSFTFKNAEPIKQLTVEASKGTKMPLIIKGCRQCGKTFSVLNFAQKHYGRPMAATT